MNPDFDVAILGAGLAGSLLARQLRLQRPDLRVIQFERSATTAYKVGEATVELFVNQLCRKLGLTTYLYERQLPKNGLRFFFDRAGKDADLLAMSEIGSKALPYHPSFQIDRQAFERDLRDMNRTLGVELLEDAKVVAVRLGDPVHEVEVATATGVRTVRSRWVVDATGRTSLLARQLGLRVPTQEHACLAAWARCRDVVDLDGHGIDAAFRERVRNTSRRLSTVHFVHRGYWIWFIPLRGGVTSVGVVGDPRHLTRAPLTADGLREFLAGHRAVQQLLRPAQWLDFGGYGQLAYGTRQYFSPQRWALVGEAAAFTDPFYSPGSDFIAVANELVGDLIARDHDGEDIGERTRAYDEYMLFRLAANLALYQGQYELLGSYELLQMKWEFDIQSYYHLWVHAYMQDAHLDLARVRADLRQRTFVLRALQRFGHLFAATERRVTARGDYERCNLGHHAEALRSVDFLTQVGMPQEPAAYDERTLRIFRQARERAFELLGTAAGDGGRWQFADYVTGRAFAGVADG